MKFAIWFVIGAVVVYWLMRANRGGARQRRPREGAGGAASRGAPGAPGNSAAPGERMVECAHCGMHVPASEAIAGPPGKAGQVFCSQAHRLLHDAR
jgi:uncharacterized protein